MQIKRFAADNINDALGLVKAEFGRDAVILSTKSLRGKGVEVMAAADREGGLSLSSGTGFQPVKAGKMPAPPQSCRIGTVPGLEQESGVRSLELKTTPISQLSTPNSQLETELKELKDMVGSLVSHVQKDEFFNGSKKLLEFHKVMVSSGIDETLSFKFLQHLFKNVEDASVLVMTLKQFLIRQIPVGKITDNGHKPKVVMFVGPTGVGKTTTIAKLAAINSLQKGKKVALVTLDTYRIAAVEQLKVYARIIGIPVHVADSPREFTRIAGDIKGADLILVDTAGRSHKDREHVEELRHVYGSGLPIETHLVLSATAKEKDTVDIIRSYKDVQIDRLLFTKLDETVTYGTIFNAAITSQKPLSYLTTGQRVPNDIEAAMPERIVDLILGSAIGPY